MAEDQAEAVESVEDLAQALEEMDSPEEEEVIDQGSEDEPVDEAEESEDEQPEEDESDESDEVEEEELRLIKIPASEETPEEEVTEEELVAGYMRNKAYTQQRQRDSEQVRQVEQRALKIVSETQQQATQNYEQLQQAVMQLASDGFSQLTPELAQSDPSTYVQLKAQAEAKQQQLGQVYQQLDQARQQAEQQAAQADLAYRQDMYQRNLVALDAYVPEFNADAGYKQKLSTFAEQAYGIPPNELSYLLEAPMFKDGQVLNTSTVVRVFNDAMKYQELQKQKPIAQKKLNKAVKTVKPKAPKPKDKHSEAKKRLRATGSVDDLAELL